VKLFVNIEFEQKKLLFLSFIIARSEVLKLDYLLCVRAFFPGQSEGG